MQTFISMLRGINVSGQKIVPMEKLRESFEKLGLENVKTYIQSGNVIFKSKATSTALCKKIETQVLKQFGYEVTVIVKTLEELESVFKKNPFVKRRGIDLTKLHVTFLSASPSKPDLKKLMALAKNAEECEWLKTEVYLYCPNG